MTWIRRQKPRRPSSASNRKRRYRVVVYLPNQVALNPEPEKYQLTCNTTAFGALSPLWRQRRRRQRCRRPGL